MGRGNPALVNIQAWEPFYWPRGTHRWARFPHLANSIFLGLRINFYFLSLTNFNLEFFAQAGQKLKTLTVPNLKILIESLSIAIHINIAFYKHLPGVTDRSSRYCVLEPRSYRLRLCRCLSCIVMPERRKWYAAPYRRAYVRWTGLYAMNSATSFGFFSGSEFRTRATL